MQLALLKQTHTHLAILPAREVLLVVTGKLKRRNKSCFCALRRALCSFRYSVISECYFVFLLFRYSVMSECWLEKPEDRPSFQWICTAMKRLINDHKVHKRESTEK